MAERGAGESKSAAMRIKLKYPDVETFLARYGSNLSRTAVFIATKSLKPVGTPLRFEFVLVNESGEQPVFRGEGVVNQVREADAVAPGKPVGMSIKFERLFGDGEALIERALALRGSRTTLPRQERPTEPPPPAREITGEVELASPREISSGEFEGLVPSPEAPAPSEPYPSRAAPPPPPAERPRSSTAHVDVDALAAQWQISTDRVDEILRRPRPRDPAYAAELEALLSAPATDAVSAGEATARLAQLLDRRRHRR